MDYYVITYGLMAISLLITLGAQGYINSSYNKYKRVNNRRGISGFEAARKILDENGLKDMYIVETEGFLSDHYDPTKKVVRLSKEIFHGESIAAVSVAAHECGHAIQDKVGYPMMRIRSAIVPFVNFSSYAGYIAIAIGAFTGLMDIIWFGIALEMVILAFQLVTLPVEINASKRGLQQIKEWSLLEDKEHSQAKTMLTAAALTYVASVATTVIESIRLILIFGRRDD